jgi:hypothetical protein
VQVAATRLAGIGRLRRERLRAFHRDAGLLRVVRSHAAQPHGVHVPRRELGPGRGETGIQLHRPPVNGEGAAQRIGRDLT